MGEEGARSWRKVSLAATIRCTACSDRFGRALVALVYTNGEREWLVMNIYERPIDEGEERRLLDGVPLPALKKHLQDADQEEQDLEYLLDWIRDQKTLLVIDLEKPEAIDDPDPLVSISCPRCSPTGHNSWFLDCKKIGSRLRPDEIAHLTTLDVVADGEHGPTLDRELGFTRSSPLKEEIAKIEERIRGGMVRRDE